MAEHSLTRTELLIGNDGRSATSSGWRWPAP